MAAPRRIYRWTKGNRYREIRPCEPWRQIANDIEPPPVPLWDKALFGVSVLGLIALVLWLGQP